MIHHRQRLALRLEAGHHLLGVHPQLDDLQRDPAAHRFLLFRHPHHAKAALADLLQQLVAPDLAPGCSSVKSFFESVTVGRRKSPACSWARSRDSHFLAQRRVASAGAVQVRGAFRWVGQRQGMTENGPGILATFFHRHPFRFSSRLGRDRQ